MWISDTSIKRPVLAAMFILALVVLGLVSYPAIGVDLFPKVDFPIVSITTRLTGAASSGRAAGPQHGSGCDATICSGRPSRPKVCSMARSCNP